MVSLCLRRRRQLGPTRLGALPRLTANPVRLGLHDGDGLFDGPQRCIEARLHRPGLFENRRRDVLPGLQGVLHSPNPWPRLFRSSRIVVDLFLERLDGGDLLPDGGQQRVARRRGNQQVGGRVIPFGGRDHPVVENPEKFGVGQRLRIMSPRHLLGCPLPEGQRVIRHPRQTGRTRHRQGIDALPGRGSFTALLISGDERVRQSVESGHVHIAGGWIQRLARSGGPDEPLHVARLFLDPRLPVSGRQPLDRGPLFGRDRRLPVGEVLGLLE